MVFIVVKFPVKPEHTFSWLEQVGPFTEATRAEPGNLWFEWSRSVGDPNTFVPVEAFQDCAGEAHVGSDHFKAGLEVMHGLVARTPDIVSTSIEGADGWRGRGERGDTQPYAPANQVEDLAALLDAFGEPATLASDSGGCLLALDAATALGDRVAGST